MSRKRGIVTGIISVAAVLLILGGTVLFLFLSKNYKYEKQISLGDKYMVSMQYEDALLAYKEAVKIDSHKETAYVQIVNTLMETEDYEKALQILDIANTQVTDKESVASFTEQREYLNSLWEALQMKQDASAGTEEDESTDNGNTDGENAGFMDLTYDIQTKTLEDTYVTVEYPYVIASGKSDTADKVNAAIEARAQASFQGMIAQIGSDAVDLETMTFEYSETIKNVYCEGGVLSVSFDFYYYAGGAHEVDGGTSAYNYNLATGEEMDMAQLLGTSKEDAKQRVYAQYTNYLNSLGSAFTGNAQSTIDNTYDSLRYWRDGENVVVQAPYYSLGSHAQGTPEIYLGVNGNDQVSPDYQY